VRTSHDFVQPLDIDFRYEDRHVIAFFDGHPEYEAVEAFLAERTGRDPLIRAILTRHDKTQIDLLNDETVLGARRAANPSREAYFATITFSVTLAGGNPHAVLKFVSHRGETFALDVLGTTPALPVFGGLTDPEGHAPDVLPVLWRDASAVAGPTSSLTIDGRPYSIPPFLVGSAQIGLFAFYTEGFAIGIVSANQQQVQLITAPAALAVGARWQFSDRVYEITETSTDRLVIRRISGVPETIEALVRDGRLHPTVITASSGSDRPGEMALAFDPSLPDVTSAGFGRDPAATFTIAVNDHAALVGGRIVPGERAFDLLPGDPAWTTSRTIHIALARAGSSWTLSSAIPSPYQGSVSP